MQINLDYKRPEPKKGEEQITNSELTVDYINYSVRTFYKDGLDSQWRRIWGRIQRKLDEALDTKVGEVNFEQAELDFLKKAVKEVKVPSELAKYFVVLEDELENKNGK